jgi:hypothetical protein
MERRSSSISYYASFITVTAAQKPGQSAIVESIEIDGELLDFKDGEIESGETLDDAIDNGLRKATSVVDF